MDMDGGTATVLMLTMAFLTLPFVLDYRRRSRKGAQVLKALHDAAQKQQCRLHKHEVLRDLGIGLDTGRRVLFFINENEEHGEIQNVHLDRVHKCRVIKAARSKNDADDAPIERVEMCLIPRTAGDERRLVLYRATFGSSMDGEIQFAEKWAGLVNELLKN